MKVKSGQSRRVRSFLHIEQSLVTILWDDVNNSLPTFCGMFVFENAM